MNEPLSSNPLRSPARAMALALRHAARTYSQPPSDEAIAKCLEFAADEIERLTAELADASFNREVLRSLVAERDRLRAALELIRDDDSMRADEMVAVARATLAGAAVETFDCLRFETAPCFVCGYKGEGYYRPSFHPCATKYHAAKAAQRTAENGDESR